MGIIVQKFGGSSVANTKELYNVCKHITKEYNKKNKIIVVVSAQGKTTDNLIKEAIEINDNINKRELDTLISIGEQITIAKLVMCLKKLGINAVSLTGWQVPIQTDVNYGDANIKHINLDRIIKELNQEKVVVIAGFQGISDDTNDITTLGRGGSDTTAVAIAAAINAERCDIFKDVDGIYNLDPKSNNNAFKYENINYEEMLELSNNGARVLHNKSIMIAKEFNVPIYVKSVYNENSKGTRITNWELI